MVIRNKEAPFLLSQGLRSGTGRDGGFRFPAQSAPLTVHSSSVGDGVHRGHVRGPCERVRVGFGWVRGLTLSLISLLTHSVGT